MKIPLSLRSLRCFGNLFCVLAVSTLLSAVLSAAPPQADNVRKLHFIQDDAQDYMISRLFELKYVQAVDLIPFVSGMVMRYNMNSSVNSLTFGSSNQYLTVTCPEKMMPYVAEFVKKADREIKIDGKVPGEIIRGTGITRAVYRPKYRSGQVLADVLINSVIGEGPTGALYAWDANSNQIYWKDNASNSAYVFQFLQFLDRPPPQITLTFTMYEIRESSLRDLGIEYLAWKNGPGMNVFQTAFRAFSLSSSGSAALQAMSGPLGGIFFAPQFDASFIRMLQQSGNADITGSASVTVSNSDTASTELSFSPRQQNIIKADNDVTSVVPGGIDGSGSNQLFHCLVTAPVVNFQYGDAQSGYPENEKFSVAPYTPGDYTKYAGTLCFGYELTSASVVERNNTGAELVEKSSVSGNALITLGQETVLGRWNKEAEVEELIGVPFLSEIPILRYLFSTVTTSKEQIRVCVTVRADLLNTAADGAVRPGTLKQIK